MAFEFTEVELRQTKEIEEKSKIFFSQVTSPIALKWLNSKLKEGASLRGDLIYPKFKKEIHQLKSAQKERGRPRKSLEKEEELNLKDSTTKKRKSEAGLDAKSPKALKEEGKAKQASQSSEEQKKLAAEALRQSILGKVSQIGARKVSVKKQADGQGPRYILNGPMACTQPVEIIEDSSALLLAGDFAGLWARYKQEGYILLRGAVPKERVLSARAQVVGALQTLKAASKDEKILKDQPGRTIQANSGDVISGTEFYVSDEQAEKERKLWKNICNGADIQGLVNGPEVTTIISKFAELHSEQSAFDFKPLNFHPFYTWLRIKGKKEMTIEHSDYFHFYRQTVLFASPSNVTDDHIDFLPPALKEDPEARFTDSTVCERCHTTDRSHLMILCDECDKGYHLDCLNPVMEEMPKDDWYCAECNPRPLLGTVWVPLEAITVEHGTFCVLPKSHSYPQYSKPYKDFQVPNSYWKCAKGQPWHVGTFEPGDMIIFDLKTVHATTRNLLDKYRLSVDTRWCLEPQRANNGLTPGSIFIQQIKDGTIKDY